MHFRNKRGLGVGQVFVFIVAAITFAFIMIFGYRAITGFLQSGEEVAFVQFKTDLESSIKKLFTEFGSVRAETFNLPSKYSQICFVDMDKPADNHLCEFYQVACTVWKNAKDYNSVDENVFLKPSAPVKIKVHKISINPGDNFGSDPGKKNFLCLPIRQGSFSVVLEGKGDRTEISPPSVLAS